MELVLFFLFGGLATIFAMGMLLSKNAVHSALFLIGNFGSVAFLFMMLEAPFISMVQIAVYAGAIMVLFLFVIMLLGAEETTDTTRNFRWLTGTSTTLAIALLAAFSIPLVLAGLDLPEPVGDDPFIRVVHGANTIDVITVDVTLSGSELDEPLVITDVSYGTVSDFVSVPAGDYTVSISLPEGVEGPTDSNDNTLDSTVPLMLPQQITLEPGQVVTAIATGTFDWENKSFISLASMENSFVAPRAGNARFVVNNLYSEAPLTLVDLGPNEVVDTRQRDVLDADGEPVFAEIPVLADNGEPLLDDDGNPVIEQGDVLRESYISDRVIASGLEFGVPSEPSEFGDGTYTLAFVDPADENAIVLFLRDYEIAANTEHSVIMVGETTGNSTRARILDGDGEQLVVRTNADFGSPASIGQILFTDYLLPVNLVGFLLLVGLVGVIVLTRPEGQKRERRQTRRRKVSRPLVNVISQQTGSSLTQDSPKLDPPVQPESGD